MNETPLPFTVFAMMQVGLPLVDAAFANASAAPEYYDRRSPDVPTECPPFVCERLQVHNVFHKAVELNFVVIDDADDIVHLVERREHRGFPDLAFLAFTVA